MLLADMIILESPVYFHSVSGLMKLFIDRLSYWSHTLQLTGKVGVIITTSSNNGNSYVREYLNKFFDYMGIATISSIDFETLNDKNTFQKNYNRIIRKIKREIKAPKIKVSQKQEEIFSYYKKLYSERLKENKFITYEANYWQNHAFFEYDTFSDLFNDLRNGKLTNQ